MGETAITLSTILTDVGSVITSAFSWVEQPVNAITSNPLLFLGCVGVPLVGLGIGLVRRIFKLRA